MITLKISEQKAKELYKSANSDLKEILKESCGEKFFYEKITDRVKTFEDACRIIGFDPEGSYVFGDSKDDTAYKKLKLISEALNEGWKPDWNNSNQYKWYPWFRFKEGFGFSLTDWGSADSVTDACSRLCFKSQELAEYAGKQFEDIYRDFLT